MGKRANGEGTVYQRKDGRWVASIVLEDEKRKSVYCKTQRQAVKEVQRANLAKDQGTLIIAADQTPGEFLMAWLRDTVRHNVRPRTYIGYRELVELHIVPLLGNIKLQKLAPQQLQHLYNQKREEGYAPQTVKNIHRVLHRALNDALGWNLVARNVCDVVATPRVPKSEMQALTGEQASNFWPRQKMILSKRSMSLLLPQG